MNKGIKRFTEFGDCILDCPDDEDGELTYDEPNRRSFALELIRNEVCRAEQLVDGKLDAFNETD